MGRGSYAAAFVITLGVAAPSTADPIALAFSNFAGNGVLTCCGGWGVPGGGLVGEPNQDRGFEFTPLISGKLSSLELVMRLDPNSEINEVDVIIAASSRGLPDTVLESFHLSNALPLAEEEGAFVPLTAITSSMRPLLRAGTPYWVFASTTGRLDAIWLSNDTGASGLTSFRNEGEEWFGPLPTAGTGALRISAEPVPEPSTILLLLSGCAAVAAARGRRVGSGSSARSNFDTADARGRPAPGRTGSATP